MYKIIIVDDEQLLRQGFIHMTNWYENGYQIVGEASNGVEALKLINDHEPHIVVSDIRMPEMDGIELIRIIKEKYPYIQVVVLSSYSDFDYVKETLKLGALDYILKPKMNTQTLMSVLEKAKQKIDENKQSMYKPNKEFYGNEIGNFFKALISYNNNDIKFIEDSIVKYKIPLQSRNMLFLAIVTINNDECLLIDKESIVKNFDLDSNSTTFMYDSNTFIAVMNCTKDELNKLSCSCSKIIEEINNNYSTDCWILMGDIFDGYSNIFDAYKSIIDILPYTFYFLKNTLLHSCDIKCRLTTNLKIDYKVYDPSIEKLDFRELKQSIKLMVIQKTLNNTFIEPFALKKTFDLVFHHIIQKLAEFGFNMEEIHKKSFKYFKDIENSKTMDQLFVVFDEIIHEIQSYIINCKNSTCYNSVIREIVKYISENYHADISLTSTAEHFHISKSYLCELFKQQIGETFNDFLTSVRINKAKELLRHPGHNISHICESVGYSNPSYFCKVFKTVVGMTPKEFSKIYGKSDLQHP